MTKKTILIPVGGRSDAGLSTPVIKRLEECNEFNIITAPLCISGLSDAHMVSYAFTEDYIQNYKLDFVLIFGDRAEMVGVAHACFNNNIPFGHVYAGIGSNKATIDDINRHVITLLSSIQFCESEAAAIRAERLCGSIGKIATPHIVGITHLDDIEYRPPGVEIPYVVVLYNPLTLGEDCAGKIESEIDEINKTLEKFHDHCVIVVGSNSDISGFSVEKKLIRCDKFYHNLARPEFIGLIANCACFITNSSTAVYEAPTFLHSDQIIMIGERNKHRDRGPFAVGASDRIVNLLRAWL